MKKTEIITELFVCDCTSIQHHFIVSVSDFQDELPMVDISLRLSTYLGFWGRVKAAWKYIFRCPNNGEYETVLLNNSTLEKLIKVLEPYKGKLEN